MTKKLLHITLTLLIILSVVNATSAYSAHRTHRISCADRNETASGNCHRPCDTSMYCENEGEDCVCDGLCGYSCIQQVPNTATTGPYQQSTTTEHHPTKVHWYWVLIGILAAVTLICWCVSCEGRCCGNCKILCFCCAHKHRY